jgi:hypothetical protein
MNPKTGQPEDRMTAEDFAVFNQRFVTLATLSAEAGHKRNGVSNLKDRPGRAGGTGFWADVFGQDCSELV